jgi:hypothetical protein
MHAALALMLTMHVTFYAPAAGGINGDLFMADGNEAHIGFAACGSRYPFGTVFEIMVDMSEYGMPQVVECRDRGGYVGSHNLDLVIRTGNVKQDLALARAWGRRAVPVRVWNSWGDYAAGVQTEFDQAVQIEAAVPINRMESREQLNPTPIP